MGDLIKKNKVAAVFAVLFLVLIIGGVISSL